MPSKKKIKTLISLFSEEQKKSHESVEQKQRDNDYNGALYYLGREHVAKKIVAELSSLL